MGVAYDGAVFKKYKKDCNLFIETGSYIGDGIQSALYAGFDKIISVELAKCQYDYCVNRFLSNDKVNIILGDTRNVLKSILNNHIEYKNIFFWLDAHCSGGSTEGDIIDIALPQELDIVLSFLLENKISAVIMMDDINIDMENKIKDKLENTYFKFLAKEPCINPYSDRIEDDRSIIVYELNV